MAGKDDDKTLEIDVDLWKLQLNLPEDTEAALAELLERFETLNSRFGQLLVYMNMVDERIQKYDGEPVVSTIIKSHIGSDGVAQIHRERPETPELIRNPLAINQDDKPSKMAKMVISHEPK